MTKPAPLAAAGRVAGAAALIAVLTVVSRLAGFGRTAVFTWTLSTSDLGGAYLVANYVPNFIFEIVAGGALASLVVPLLAGAVEAGDRRAVAATTGALLTWTLSLLVPLAVLVAVFADPLPGLLGHGLSEAQQASGARMLRVFAPQLPLYGVGIVLTGVLQAHRRFAWPVIAPLLSSVTVIAVYLGFTAVEGRLATIGEAGRGGELLLAGGTTLGVVVLSLSLLIPLRRLRLRPRPGYRFPADARARVGGLVVAGAVTVAAQQIALAVTLNQVTYGRTADVGVFNLAQTVYFLPWAVLAVPLAVAAYPTLVAARASGDERAYRDTLAPAVRGVRAVQPAGRRRAGRHRDPGRALLLRRPGRRAHRRRRHRRVRARPARLRPLRGPLPGALRARRDPRGERRHRARLAERARARGPVRPGAAADRPGARGDACHVRRHAAARRAAARRRAACRRAGGAGRGRPGRRGRAGWPPWSPRPAARPPPGVSPA